MEGQVVINTTPIYLGFGETYSEIGDGKVEEFDINKLFHWNAKLSPSDAEALYIDMGLSLEALNDFFGEFDSISHFIKKEGDWAITGSGILQLSSALISEGFVKKADVHKAFKKHGYVGSYTDGKKWYVGHQTVVLFK